MQRVTLFPNIYAELARISLTVSALADYMGMTPQNLYGKLKGNVSFTVWDMKQIQEFFKVKGGGTFTLDYLFETKN